MSLSEPLETAVVWFRRDCRVQDNPALTAAWQCARTVIPVYIWVPEEEGHFQPGRCSRWWTKQTLTHLSADLSALGSRLVVQRGHNSNATLQQLVRQVGAKAVFFNHLYDPISLVRDHEVKQSLGAMGVAVRSFNGDLLYEPWELMDANNEPFTRFAHFWERLNSMAYPPAVPLPAPSALPPVLANVVGVTLDEVDFFVSKEQQAASEQLRFKWRPGLAGAAERFEAFVQEHLGRFEVDKAKVDRSSTSQVSPWVHIGTISVRQIFFRVKQFQAEWGARGHDCNRCCTEYLRQMAYREYSRYLSFHFPFLHERALLAHVRAVPWNADPKMYKAWKQGMTGVPIVDAGMKQLHSTGWMHNRVRVVAASFMVKNLLLPWQWGLKHYWDCLLDADLEAAALGWQYVAGCMADAHPFSYMLDFELESRRFDPDGEYVRRWLPVLSRLPTEYIHQPWTAPPGVLAAADVELGFNYPKRVISDDESRRLVAQACRAIEENAARPAVSHEPYNPPSYPETSSGQTSSAYSRPPQVSIIAPGFSDYAVPDVDSQPIKVTSASGGVSGRKQGSSGARARRQPQQPPESMDSDHPMSEGMSNSVKMSMTMPTEMSGFEQSSHHWPTRSEGPGRSVPCMSGAGSVGGALVPSMSGDPQHHQSRLRPPQQQQQQQQQQSVTAPRPAASDVDEDDDY